MKYAVSFFSNFRYMKEVDEVIFTYTEKNIGHLNQINSYIDKNTQTAIVQLEDLSNEKMMEVFTDLLELKSDLNNNLILMIDFKNKGLIKELKDYNFKYMFKDYARSKEMIDAMGAEGACSVYIVEELAFNLKALKYLKDKYNLEYRVFPDIAQSTKGTGDYVDPLCKFFIRPEDTEVYEDYVDVFEFYHIGEQLSPVYEVYKKQQWLGNLNDLILSLSDDKIISNRTITPHFGQMRVDCNKICLCGKCCICEEITKLADSFGEAGLEIIKKKKKVERTEEEKEAAIEELKTRGKEIIDELGTNETDM